MAEKWREAPIAVTFFGQGFCISNVRHLFLPCSELLTARHEMHSSSYFAEKGAAVDTFMKELPLGFAERAYNSAIFIPR